MLSRFLALRSWELARNWISTMGTWGAVGTVGLLWSTDWWLILDWVTYIKGKFKKDD
ncbi:cytochrome b-c1 complex subunit 10-like [Balaenoptera acutorostrata]|uniref:Cytochrome b-c1 complex subunit 10-like n=1 Tax=Balaenoptera acutorostrata TaxID=9767 RepID=A0ABM3T776_BALAC|nr:cytochrome b-c1 complex subunit 10-like [Balaenoptera acutorostrata]